MRANDGILYACSAAVRRFDFTWMRAVTPGSGTAPLRYCLHGADGTTNLYTAWTPLAATSHAIGSNDFGGSHSVAAPQLRGQRRRYLLPITTLCEAPGNNSFGALRSTRSAFGTARQAWLTAWISARGDLLTFGHFDCIAAWTTISMDSALIGHALPTRVRSCGRALGR